MSSIFATIRAAFSKTDRPFPTIEAIAVIPEPPKAKATISAIPPACQNCRHRLEGVEATRWNTKCFEMGNSGPTDNAFECRYFVPRHKVSPIACAYYPPYHPKLGEEREQELQASLNKPIRIKLQQNWLGVRDVEISPPWANIDEKYCDVSLGEDPRTKTNTEGGIRMACVGFEDYYCNIGAREAALFAWECALGAAIAKSLESFEEFWANPGQFLENFPNPEGYKTVILKEFD